MKIYIILAFNIVLLGVVINQYQTKIKYLEQKLTLHQQNQHLLNNKIKEIYDAKIILEEQTKKLKQEALKDSFNWYSDISNTYVIKQLQKD